jgi:sterol desaturase/sphingolipid hydroxylase (fatty acid hydroxylase superfamily)
MSSAWLLAHESVLRSALFFSLLAILGLAQALAPCRGDAQPARRQLVNLGLIALDTALIRAVFPFLGIAFAMQLSAAGIGLFALLAWPSWLEVVLAVVALDMAIYFQHRLFHLVPWFWRAHRVHHSDTGFDVSLGVRFHPLEIAVSQLIKFAAIAILGAAPVAVLVFEMLLLGGSLFTHSDFALPARMDRALRWLIVTPNMHRVHHSTAADETNRNFGFNLSWWDRLFGSYARAPREPEASMAIGLKDFRGQADQGLMALLVQPFRTASAVASETTENTHA